MTPKQTVVFVAVFLATFVLAVSAGVGTVGAQTSVTEDLNETYGGTDFERAFSVVQTSDGGYALAGFTSSFGPGKGNAWLIKTDSNGNVQINETYGGGSGFERANSIVQTSDGGYALAGFTESFGSGSTDAWLVKTDSDGNVEINKTFGGVNSDVANSVVQTPDGGYALGGTTNSFGPGSSGAWLVKTDSDGNVEINKTFGGANKDGLFSMVQTSDGGYALAGVFATETKPSGDDAWLVKTDSNGNAQINETYGGSDREFARSVIQTSDGGYALGGRTSSFDLGRTDAWLVKTDSNGAEQFNQSYGGTDFETAFSVVQTPDGGYALGGTTNSFDLGGGDAWLAKANASGQEKFNETYGGSGDDEARSVIQTSDGGYALTGGTKSFGSGSKDAFLTKVSAELFTQSLITRFGMPPTNIPANDPQGFSDTLYEDLDGDREGTDVSQTVAVFGELIRGNTLNGDAQDGGLTDDQARALNWNSGSPETEVTPADMVSLFGRQIRAD